jgi:hypothetical protein
LDFKQPARRHMRHAASDQICTRGGQGLERICRGVDTPSQLPSANQPRRHQGGRCGAHLSALLGTDA